VTPAQADPEGMSNNNVHGRDPVVDFITGRDGECWSLASAVAVTFGSCLLLSALDAVGLVDGTLAFATIVAIVGVVSWWTSPAAAVVAALVGFLFADGFVFDASGTLAWHGEADVVRLTVMVGLAVVASILGRLHSHRGSPDRVHTAPVLHDWRG
jgi:K+-sensing histidine kinase KdpD